MTFNGLDGRPKRNGRHLRATSPRHHAMNRLRLLPRGEHSGRNSAAPMGRCSAASLVHCNAALPARYNEVQLVRYNSVRRAQYNDHRKVRYIAERCNRNKEPLKDVAADRTGASHSIQAHL